MRPELQDKVHQSFEQEISTLDKMFDSEYFLRILINLFMPKILSNLTYLIIKFFLTDGAAYCLGSVNRDCWYVFMYLFEL